MIIFIQYLWIRLHLNISCTRYGGSTEGLRVLLGLRDLLGLLSPYKASVEVFIVLKMNFIRLLCSKCLECLWPLRCIYGIVNIYLRCHWKQIYWLEFDNLLATSKRRNESLQINNGSTPRRHMPQDLVTLGSIPVELLSNSSLIANLTQLWVGQRRSRLCFHMSAHCPGNLCTLPRQPLHIAPATQTLT